jgi:cytochrome b561
MANDPTRSTGLSERRYSLAAIVLHWTIAALILTQIGLGWYMNEVLPDHTPAQDQVEGLHISLGLLTLLFILLRIAIRIIHRPPPLPPEMAGWERVLAQATHAAFYVLMLALPLTGWMMVSAHPEAIHFFGLGFPHMPGVAGLLAQGGKPLRHTLQWLHTYVFIWIILVTLALHVAGALKHQFDGHPVLWRMIPGLKPRAL